MKWNSFIYTMDLFLGFITIFWVKNVLKDYPVLWQKFHKIYVKY